MNRAKGDATDRSINAGSDFLQLDVSQAPVGGRSAWLARELQRAISDGRLPPGARLPASRVLAADLQVSRGVVTEAYARLAEAGHVTGRGRSGTIVSGPLVGPQETGTSETGTSESGTGQAAVVSGKVFEAPLTAAVFGTLRSAPARIDLSPGVPDLAAFPRAAWLRAERAVLHAATPADFGYGDPRGTPGLRRSVSDWLMRFRGIRVDPDGVIIVGGVAQALALLAQTLRRRGIDRVAVEDPGSLGARQQLQSWGLSTRPVPVGDDGLDADALAADGSSVVMITPAHQFPTGVVLSGERRRRLLRWLDGGGSAIEDDYDAEHRYDRTPVAALKSVAPDRVSYTGSVSKLLAPALRIGWLVPPAADLDSLIEAKRHADLGNAGLAQLVLAHLMDSGALERQLRMVRRRHIRRRDSMLAALRRHLPGVAIHGAAAGLHLMITFEQEFDDAVLAADALEQGVKVQPLSWHRQSSGRPGLVLGYAASPTGEIEEGIATIGRLVHTSGRVGA